MTTLSKTSREYILDLIKTSEIKSILSYCEGLGLDTTKYSSPVHYGSGKLTIKYRGSNEYYYI